MPAFGTHPVEPLHQELFGNPELAGEGVGRHPGALGEQGEQLLRLLEPGPVPVPALVALVDGRRPRLQVRILRQRPPPRAGGLPVAPAVLGQPADGGQFGGTPHETGTGFPLADVSRPVLGKVRVALLDEGPQRVLVEFLAVVQTGQDLQCGTGDRGPHPFVRCQHGGLQHGCRNARGNAVPAIFPEIPGRDIRWRISDSRGGEYEGLLFGTFAWVRSARSTGTAPGRNR